MSAVKVRLDNHPGFVPKKAISVFPDTPGEESLSVFRLPGFSANEESISPSFGSLLKFCAENSHFITPDFSPVSVSFVDCKCRTLLNLTLILDVCCIEGLKFNNMAAENSKSVATTSNNLFRFERAREVFL